MIPGLEQLFSLLFGVVFQYLLLERKYGRTKNMSISVSVIATVLLLNILFLQKNYIAFSTIHPFTMEFPVFLVFGLLSKYKDGRALFGVLTGICFSVLIQIPAALCSLWFRNDFISIMVESIVFVPLLIAVRQYFRPLYLQVLNTVKKGWRLFCVVPLLYDVLIYFLFTANQTGLNQPVSLITMIVATLMVVTVYWIIIILFHQTQQQYTMQNEQQLLAIQVMALQNQFDAVRDAEEKVTIHRHDTRHYQHHILALLQSGDIKSAIEFLSNWDKIYGSTEVVHYCENQTINAILAYYLKDAKQNGIALITKLDIPEKIPVDAIELSIVFANAIENAVHACQKLPEGAERSIEFTCVSKPHFVFEIANPYRGDLYFDENGYPLSSDEGHGIGSISIAAFVKKYNAVIGYRTENDMFKLRIMLNECES